MLIARIHDKLAIKEERINFFTERKLGVHLNTRKAIGNLLSINKKMTPVIIIENLEKRGKI